MNSLNLTSLNKIIDKIIKKEKVSYAFTKVCIHCTKHNKDAFTKQDIHGYTPLQRLLNSVELPNDYVTDLIKYDTRPLYIRDFYNKIPIMNMIIERRDFDAIELVKISPLESLKMTYKNYGQILHLAVHFCAYSVIRAICNRADIKDLINQKDSLNRTPLDIAISFDDETSVTILTKLN